MAGTKAGGIKSRDKNLAKDPDFYKKNGALGGKIGTTGGFASKKPDKNGLTGKERARKYGAIGGKKSRRSGIKNGETANKI
jgi:hypothetical protein